MSLGYDNPGTASGTLRVEAGGQLLLTGNALSNPTVSRTTALHIGGRGDALPGTGTATVTGAGSKIVVAGLDAYLGVGRGALNGQFGNGQLDVFDKGQVGSTSMVVGAFGNGAVNVDDASITLSGARTNIDTGAGSTIGRGASGAGTVTLSNGAQLNIVNNIKPSGLSLGGDGVASGGSGTLNLTTASSLNLSGSFVSHVYVGGSGTGSLNASGASQINLGARALKVGT